MQSHKMLPGVHGTKQHPGRKRQQWIEQPVTVTSSQTNIPKDLLQWNPTCTNGWVSTVTVSMVALKDQGMCRLPNPWRSCKWSERSHQRHSTLHCPNYSTWNLWSKSHLRKMGQGTEQIGQVSPVANKTHALFGKGAADLGVLQVILIPDSIRAKVTVKTLTDAAILLAFQGGNQLVDQQVAPWREATTDHTIMGSQPTQSLMASMRISTHQWFMNGSWTFKTGCQWLIMHWHFFECAWSGDGGCRIWSLTFQATNSLAWCILWWDSGQTTDSQLCLPSVLWDNSWSKRYFWHRRGKWHKCEHGLDQELWSISMQWPSPGTLHWGVSRINP